MRKITIGFEANSALDLLSLTGFEVDLGGFGHRRRSDERRNILMIRHGFAERWRNCRGNFRERSSWTETIKKKPLIPNSLSTLCWFWPETGFFDVCEVSGDTRARNKSLCTGLISTSSDIPNKSFGLLPPWKIEKRKYKNEDTSSMNGSSFKWIRHFWKKLVKKKNIYYVWARVRTGDL